MKIVFVVACDRGVVIVHEKYRRNLKIPGVKSAVS